MPRPATWPANGWAGWATIGLDGSPQVKPVGFPRVVPGPESDHSL